MQTPLVYRHLPAQISSPENPTLVMLHGRGSDENDLFGLANQFDKRLTIYSLRAPFEFDFGGFTWFELFDDGTVDDKSFEQSTKAIVQFLYQLKTQQLYLMGFSMGAIMSYSLALAQPELCNGIICCSGFAPLQLEHQYKLQELLNLHIFASHGINDQLIPIASARKTKELLSQSNANFTYHEYPMAHQINEKCLLDIKEWMDQRLKQNSGNPL
ncbi:MAG: dienelactone hydrolase family protein [Bacteroidota bacterium]|nr:dienelactone hydrolase family protein [Bacteroidota bacterium]